MRMFRRNAIMAGITGSLTGCLTAPVVVAGAATHWRVLATSSSWMTTNGGYHMSIKGFSLYESIDRTGTDVAFGLYTAIYGAALPGCSENGPLIGGSGSNYVSPATSSTPQWYGCVLPSAKNVKSAKVTFVGYYDWGDWPKSVDLQKSIDNGVSWTTVASAATTNVQAEQVVNFAVPDQGIAGDAIIQMPMTGPSASTNFFDYYGHVTTAYGNATQNGTHAVFDGNGDYIGIAPKTADEFLFPGDFTIECKVTLNTLSSGPHEIFNVSGTSTGFDFRWYSGNWEVSLNAGSGTTIGGAAPTVGVECDVAIVRYNGVIRLYVQGVNNGTSLSNSSTLGYSSQTMYIGGVSGGNFLNGKIRQYRISKFARYTANYVPATTFNPPASAIPSLVLMHFDGANGATTFTDVYGHSVARFGTTAALSTYSPKFGATSLAVTNNGLTITPLAADDFVFPGDLTIEAWVNLTSLGGAPQSIFGMKNGSTYFDFRWYANNGCWQVSANGGAGSDLGGTITANTWTHAALVRSGSTLKLYVNGVATGVPITGVTKTLGFSGLNACVGCSANGENLLSGRIDDFRISKGARYTANFTPVGPFTV